MSTARQVEIVNSELLFMAYHLAKKFEHGQRQGTLNNGWLRYYGSLEFGFGSSVLSKINCDEHASYLVTLCTWYGVIKELKLNIRRGNNVSLGGEQRNYSFGMRPQNLGDDAPPNLEEGDYFSAEMLLDYEGAANFIASYLSNWKEGNLYRQGINMLKADMQIYEVVNGENGIKNLLRDHSGNSLQILEPQRHTDQIDFIATLLHLQYQGDLEVLEISCSEEPGYPWFARIKIENKFHEDFDEKTPLAPTEEGVVSFKRITTDFNHGKIWISEQDKRKFVTSWSITKLWKLLLSNPGEIFNYEAISHELGWSEGYRRNQIPVIKRIQDTKKNLVRSLERLGLTEEEVSGLIVDNKGYGLTRV